MPQIGWSQQTVGGLISAKSLAGAEDLSGLTLQIELTAGPTMVVSSNTYQ